MIMWIGLLFTSVTVSFLFTGCVSIEKSYPDKRYFVLDIARDASPQNPGETGTLQIASARVSPRYADKNFVYRRSDARFESDFYNEFLISPGVLVAEELRQELSQSGIFKFVVGSVNALAPTHTLEIVVNTLYGDFRDLRAPKAVMDVEFFLSQEGSPGGIIFHKRYHESIPLEARNPEALVQGWNRALEGISSSLVSDLQASNLHLERRSTSRSPAFQVGFDARGARAQPGRHWHCPYLNNNVISRKDPHQLTPIIFDSVRFYNGDSRSRGDGDYGRWGWPLKPRPKPASCAAQAPATLPLKTDGPSIVPSSPLRPLI